MNDLLARWLFSELSCFEDRAQRQAAWESAANANRLRFVGAVLMATIVTMGCFAVAFEGAVTLRHLLGRWIMTGMVAFAAAGLGGMGTGVLALAFVRRSVRRTLRRQLTDAGMPMCVDCGYDLRGQTEPRCPECGTPFDQ
jgi:protein-S-isoprenylcysteine O-methyltransferase Ste14